MKWIDIPPVWLLAHLGAVWLLAPYLPLGFGFAWVGVFGTLLLIGGLSLMLMAVYEMHRAKTTPIPHMQPSALVSSGVFGLSRNPIYLGDALILAGVVLRADAPLLLVLVPVFMWIIARRFISAEEGRLRSAFGAAFEDYSQKTRRWL